MRPGMAVWRKDARGDFAFVFPGIARVAHALTHSWFDLMRLCVLLKLCCGACGCGACGCGACGCGACACAMLPVLLHAPCLNSGADHMIRTGKALLPAEKDPEPRGGNREARGGKPACST